MSQTHLTEDVQKKHKVKIVRHDETVGLIGSKKDGGDAATGGLRNAEIRNNKVPPAPNYQKTKTMLENVGTR